MSAPSARQIPAGAQVRIRMYRQGLGDCFLLTFFGDFPRHILIDCGVLNGTPYGKSKIRRVAANIREVTNSRLSALAVTHEHWDHISGFYDARDIFDNMDIGEIWLAWTEDPRNPAARNMKQQNRAKLKAIHLALAQLANVGDPRYQVYGQGISNLLGFFGGLAEGATLAAFAEKTSEAMAMVTQRRPSPQYWEPRDLIQPDWLPGVRIYVLGPPLNTATYGFMGVEGAFLAALEQALGLDDLETVRRFNDALPFYSSLMWSEAKNAKINKGPLFYQAYMANAAAWRRIDHDWLLSMARLALQLDNDLNNSSLVLAFEFADTGQVLLFPGDAQIGSWMSWVNMSWQKKFDDGRVKIVNTADLLGRTDFYKVSHHGSQNATLMKGGLEAMTNPNLVAALPVDQNFANNSKHWDMPAKPLYQRLLHVTGGRLLRADAAWPGAGDRPPQGLSPKDWQDFAGMVHLDLDGLFIDLFVK